jgi:hypothetical protein
LAYNGQTRGNYDEKAIEFISYESFLRAQRTQLLLFLEVHAFGKTHEKRKTSCRTRAFQGGLRAARDH